MNGPHIYELHIYELPTPSGVGLGLGLKIGFSQELFRIKIT